MLLVIFSQETWDSLMTSESDMVTLNRYWYPWWDDRIKSLVGTCLRERERMGDSVMYIYFSDFWSQVNETKRVLVEVGNERQTISYILMHRNSSMYAVWWK